MPPSPDNAPASSHDSSDDSSPSPSLGSSDGSSPGSEEFVSIADLHSAVTARLQRMGFSAAAAAAAATTHVKCERDGALSHGVFRVPQYKTALDAGYLHGTAEPEVVRLSDSAIRVMANSNVAQLAHERAQPYVRESLDTTGVAVLTLVDSHHQAALWPDIEGYAEAGCLAITVNTAGTPAVAPGGAHHRILSTNPMAFAVPVEGHDPFVADFATSQMSLGDLALAAQAGEPVAEGVGVDGDGNPTTGASAILNGGAVLPFGGHKGGALAIFVELLASALGGGQFTFEADREDAKPEGSVSSRTGQFVLVIDPNVAGSPLMAQRAAVLTELLRSDGMSRLPGDHRYATRRLAEERGIPVTDAIREILNG